MAPGCGRRAAIRLRGVLAEALRRRQARHPATVRSGSQGLFTASAGKLLPGKAVLINHAAMEGDRIASATARIEAAMRRIETAAARPAGGRDTELEARYARLRSEAGAALADLDRIIGTLEA
jgi:hypothetical protein